MWKLKKTAYDEPYVFYFLPDNEMSKSRSCGMYAGEEKCTQSFAGEAWRKEMSLRSMHRWEGSFKIAPKESGCEVTDWIYHALGMDKWQVIMNTVMNLQGPSNARNFYTSWETTSL